MKERLVRIRSVQTSDKQGLTRLIAEFRASMAELRGRVRPVDLAAAGDELTKYTGKGFPIYVAEDDTASLVGYLVCRVDGHIVWAEALYIAPEYRRRGIGSTLFAEVERLAQELGNDFPYNWVDPDNVRIIRFLEKRGYSVLNLIELRRPYPTEKLTQKIIVGSHEFDR
jgi:ribosomal protein S18 acetylase RimI-like enzyme